MQESYRNIESQKQRRRGTCSPNLERLQCVVETNMPNPNSGGIYRRSEIAHVAHDMNATLLHVRTQNAELRRTYTCCNTSSTHHLFSTYDITTCSNLRVPHSWNTVSIIRMSKRDDVDIRMRYEQGYVWLEIENNTVL